MKPIRRTLILIAVLATATVAQAAADPDAKFFKSFTGVAALLRANGVEPSRLQSRCDACWLLRQMRDRDRLA